MKSSKVQLTYNVMGITMAVVVEHLPFRYMINPEGNFYQNMYAVIE